MLTHVHIQSLNGRPLRVFSDLGNALDATKHLNGLYHYHTGQTSDPYSLSTVSFVTELKNENLAQMSLQGFEKV